MGWQGLAMMGLEKVAKRPGSLQFGTGGEGRNWTTVELLIPS